MQITNLRNAAQGLETSWRSKVIGMVGSSAIKVLRMDENPYPIEIHDYDEALIVMDGCMKLEVDGTVYTINSGDCCLVQANVPHAVAQGSTGTLLIVDVP